MIEEMACSMVVLDFFVKQKTAYGIRLSLGGSEMCIGDRCVCRLEPVAADDGFAHGAQSDQAAMQQRQQGEEPAPGSDAPRSWTRGLAPQYSTYGAGRLDDVVRGVEWRACGPQAQQILEERRSIRIGEAAFAHKTHKNNF